MSMKPTVHSYSNGHDWADWVFSGMTLVCCNKCGIVRRADDQNKPCKGVVKVSLREGQPNPNIVERTEG
jgi:hypothetical protein